MSNMPNLRRLNPGSGQMARPKYKWRGYRPPRSARKRWEQWMAFQRAQDQLNENRLTLPEPEMEPSSAVKKWAEANDINISDWQEHILEKAFDTEGPIKVG